MGESEKKRKRDAQDGVGENGAEERAKEVKKTKLGDGDEMTKKEQRKAERSAIAKEEKKKRKEAKKEKKEREGADAVVVGRVKGEVDEKTLAKREKKARKKEKKKAKKEEKKDRRKEREEKKERKKEKKEKREKEAGLDNEDEDQDGGVPVPQDHEMKDVEPEAETNGANGATEDAEVTAARDPKSQRFIVFIGTSPTHLPLPKVLN